MSEEISFRIPAVEVTGDSGNEIREREQSSLLLADALARMDGLIGDYRPPSELIEVSLVHDPAVRAIVNQATLLSEKMKSWDETRQEEVKGHPKDCIPANIREFIITWLSSKRQGSFEELERLKEDKSELLKQVVSLQQQLEGLNNDREKLNTKVVDLERRVIEKEDHIRSLSEELKLTKAVLHTKEVEVRQLHNEIKAGIQTSSTTNDHTGKPRRVTIQTPPSLDKQTNSSMTRKGSFREALAKRFGKKKSKAASLDQQKENSSPVKPVNPRASAFYSMNYERIAEWFSSIGLDMYEDLVTQNLLTGEALAGMVSRQGNADFVRMGIVSTLHCKKLRLAVEDALLETPSRVAELDHHWVGEWLQDIGLSQYQQTFMDARFDGRMLNVITTDDLNLLEVVAPFHIISIKRAIQALRMCGYDGSYLKSSRGGQMQKSHGSNKLVRWSASDVEQWVRSIELDDYIGGLSGIGLHGALMLLDVQFTSESLARALGITSSKTLIRTHLSRKFMELIGPIAAQDKVDAMQGKSFIPLDPTEAPRGRHRSRSQGSRRGRHPLPEVLLCPFDQFPECLIQSPSRPLLLSPTSSHSTVSSDHPLQPRPPTP